MPQDLGKDKMGHATLIVASDAQIGVLELWQYEGEKFLFGEGAFFRGFCIGTLINNTGAGAGLAARVELIPS